ncbi:Uncharacterized protein family UPF0497, trans-membrane plant [Cynara cardunculus var. scolymus]|uniref:CASP-like protein n=1 Tax=Cynara cardunculus var. scolymus TaxID=59895 RepID=A0A103XD63_CYNCS|nr:Uncharacterized protein family UPF0497, trans-membrane plant [Cynara cardunculus var. scolymus]
MASKSTTTPPHSTVKSPASPPSYMGASGLKHHVVVDVVLRVMLFATTLVGVFVMVTSKQTKMIPVAPGLVIPLDAKFTQSPAFIVITGVLSILALIKRKGSSAEVLFHFVILDALLLAIMASATGAAGAVAYIGFKGNSHTRWNKVCDIYDSFCGHVAASVVLSALPSVALLLLVWLSVFVLSKKITRQ